MSRSYLIGSSSAGVIAWGGGTDSFESPTTATHLNSSPFIACIVATEMLPSIGFDLTSESDWLGHWYLVMCLRAARGGLRRA